MCRIYVRLFTRLVIFKDSTSEVLIRWIIGFHYYCKRLSEPINSNTYHRDYWRWASSGPNVAAQNMQRLCWQAVNSEDTIIIIFHQPQLMVFRSGLSPTSCNLGQVRNFTSIVCLQAPSRPSSLWYSWAFFESTVSLRKPVSVYLIKCCWFTLTEVGSGSWRS